MTGSAFPNPSVAKPSSQGFLYASVFLLSACALSYEILLMRLFSIIQWHHFAYMIIGLALLGYGISGSLVSLLQGWLLSHFRVIYIACVLLFGLSSVACFRLAQQVPFNAEEILWDKQQWLYLGSMFLLLSIPFFFAASAICLAFMRFKQSTAQIYAADLIGAGAGSLGIVALLFWLFPQNVLVSLGLIAMFAALLAVPLLRDRRKTLLLVIGLASGALLWLAQSLVLQPSPYKSLQQTLLMRGAELVQQKSSPLGMLSVVENERVPFRHAPGLSLNARTLPLPQKALFTDGEGMTVVTQFPDQLAQLAYLDDMTSALPYHLQAMPSVLIAGGGGGQDVLQALYHQIDDIEVLEVNPQIVELVDQALGDFSGRLYSRPGVHTQIMELRDYLSTRQRQFPLIQLSLMDAFQTSAGLHALQESYLYTTEAIELYLAHLQSGGYLALTRWISLPPKDSLKLLHTVIQALQKRGIVDASEQLVMIRGWQTITLLVKNGRFSEQELSEVRRFCRQRSFDLVWLPGMSSEEANQYNRFASAVFYDAAQALLSTRAEAFIQHYKFDLRAATDNRPYFHHYFRWRTFQEVFALRDQGGMPLMEWGYLVLWATLLIALLSSVLLILLPLWFFARDEGANPTSIRRRHVVLYFFTIGLAFLMIEIAFMQKFMLFLHHPTYAIATTLTAFLVFAGLGSHYSARLVRKMGSQRLLRWALSGLVLTSLVYLWGFASLFESLAHWQIVYRMVFVVILIAPLAFAMGMPFPLALSSLAEHAPGYIPWAWGINGCASVISAALATILSINVGFNWVILLALLLYLVTVYFFPAPAAQRSTKPR